MSSKTFTVTFYNVFPGMYLMINKNVYISNGSDNYSVTLSGQEEGNYLTVYVEASGDCTGTLNTIFITLPYYNSFFRV